MKVLVFLVFPIQHNDPDCNEEIMANEIMETLGI